MTNFHADMQVCYYLLTWFLVFFTVTTRQYLVQIAILLLFSPEIKCPHFFYLDTSISDYCVSPKVFIFNMYNCIHTFVRKIWYWVRKHSCYRLTQINITILVTCVNSMSQTSNTIGQCHLCTIGFCLWCCHCKLTNVHTICDHLPSDLRFAQHSTGRWTKNQWLHLGSLGQNHCTRWNHSHLLMFNNFNYLCEAGPSGCRLCWFKDFLVFVMSQTLHHYIFYR